MLQGLIRCHSADKINSYNRGEKKEKRKKSKRIYRTSQTIRIIQVFLESLLFESFPSLGAAVHLTSQHALHHGADLWTCCAGSSDSNLVLLLCVFASNVHSYQKQYVFLYGRCQCPFIYFIDTVCLADHVDLICRLYIWWEGFGSSSLATLPLGFNCCFISTSACGLSTGICS